MGLKSVVLRRRAPQPGGSYPRRTEGPRRKERRKGKRDTDEGLRRNDTMRTKTHYGRSDAMNSFGIEREAKERQEGLLREAPGARSQSGRNRTDERGRSKHDGTSDWHATLQDRRPPSLRRCRRVRLARRLEERAHRGRGPRRLGAGGPLGAAQRSWRLGR